MGGKICAWASLHAADCWALSQLISNIYRETLAANRKPQPVVMWVQGLWQTAAAPATQIFMLMGTLVLLPIILGYMIFVYSAFSRKLREAKAIIEPSAIGRCASILAISNGTMGMMCAARRCCCQKTECLPAEILRFQPPQGQFSFWPGLVRLRLLRYDVLRSAFC
jgi:hypothetical protein